MTFNEKSFRIIFCSKCQKTLQDQEQRIQIIDSISSFSFVPKLYNNNETRIMSLVDLDHDYCGVDQDPRF